MPQSLPKITVGITCFNAADTIGRAVRSALAQDWPDFEILIVDDASTDDSVQVLEADFGAVPQIKIIHQVENKGYPAALNTILKHANGSFVAFFDDDDESAPERLRLQYERLTKYEEIRKTKDILCYTDRMVVKPDKENLMKAIGRASKEPYGKMVADFLLWHKEEPEYSWGQFGSCTLMARKGVLQQQGGFDETFRRMAEWDFAIRFALADGHFISVDRPLVRQYITHTADKAGKTSLKYAYQLRRKHQAYLKEQGLYAASFMVARSRFCYAKGRRWKSRFFLALACLMSTKIRKNEWAKRQRGKRK
jgi:glycosyltransferase involved in cell wall biosynthesis